MFCKNHGEGNACKCISPEVCESGCDVYDYGEPHAHSLIHFDSSYQKGVEDPSSPDLWMLLSGCLLIQTHLVMALPKPSLSFVSLWVIVLSG